MTNSGVPITVANLAWLAGLLDGEGWFGARANNALAVKLKMCDEDAVVRAAELIGLASDRVHRSDGYRDHWRPCYTLQITSTDADRVMRGVRPFMGLRRSAKIDGILCSGPHSHAARRPKPFSVSFADAPEISIAWLSGVLEGEGCFSVFSSAKDNRRPRIRVILKMCDGDVVVRAATAMQVSTDLIHMYDRPEGQKPIYQLQVSSHDAERVMRSVRPWMCARRGEKIDAILSDPNLSHR